MRFCLENLTSVPSTPSVTLTTEYTSTPNPDVPIIIASIPIRNQIEKIILVYIVGCRLSGNFIYTV
ncbi:MAG: hypothetical protein ACFFCG_06470 [Promethearchaeota archaeon]